MAEWHTFHTARKTRRCAGGNGTTRCLGRIERGDRYCRSSLAPGGELGGETWWRQALCIPCAAGYGHCDPAAVDVSAVPR